MTEENLEQITKEEFDNYFKHMIKTTEEQLRILSEQYISLLDFRTQYRKDYKSNRIFHYIKDKAMLYYKLGAKRVMGYNQNRGKQDDKK